jgi:hypothetical protein
VAAIGSIATFAEGEQLHSASTSQKRSAQPTLPVTQSLHVGWLIAFLRLALPAAMTRSNRKSRMQRVFLRIRPPLTSLRHARK